MNGRSRNAQSLTISSVANMTKDCYSPVNTNKLILKNTLSIQYARELSKLVFFFLTGLFFSNRGCSSGWIASLQFCYRIEPDWKKTWHDSKKTCDEKFANLVSIGSQEEYEFLEKVLHNKQVSSCLHIGLQMYDTESTPSWVDGNLWNISRLNFTSAQENGTNMCVYRDVDGLWYLTKCSTRCGFICKKYRGRC